MPIKTKDPVTRLRGDAPPAAPSGPVSDPPPFASLLSDAPPYVWEVPANAPIPVTIIVPPDTLLAGQALGARIEVPGTRAIASYWRAATLAGDLYSVTLDGVVAPGPYNLVWMTDGSPPSFQQFYPLIVVDPLTPASNVFPPIDKAAIRPSVADIAALDMTRAVDQTTGENIGTFNENTFPSGPQVDALIDDAISDVLASIPDQVDPGNYDRITYAVKLTAAILLEESYFRNEASNSGQVATWQTRLNQVTSDLSMTKTGTGQRLR